MLLATLQALFIFIFYKPVNTEISQSGQEEDQDNFSFINVNMLNITWGIYISVTGS